MGSHGLLTPISDVDSKYVRVRCDCGREYNTHKSTLGKLNITGCNNHLPYNVVPAKGEARLVCYPIASKFIGTFSTFKEYEYTILLPYLYKFMGKDKIVQRLSCLYNNLIVYKYWNKGEEVEPSLSEWAWFPLSEHSKRFPVWKPLGTHHSPSELKDSCLKLKRNTKSKWYDKNINIEMSIKTDIVYDLDRWFAVGSGYMSGRGISKPKQKPKK